MKIVIATLHVRPSAQAVPLAAGCLKASLPEQLQRQTHLIDLFSSAPPATFCQELLRHKPDIIAFPLYLWNRLQIVELARQLRREKGDLVLLAGGPEASGDSLNLIREGVFDAIIRGEGEVSFTKVIEAAASGREPVQIAGLVTATETGSTIPAAAVCPDLAALPSPWLSGQIPLSRGCGVLWEVARGCQFNCAFCYDAKGHQGVRPFPAERLRAELELFSRTGVAQIWVLDSTFNAPPERGKQLLEMLLETAPQIHYHIEAKADFLDSGTIELLGQLSCSVQIGLQSAAEQVLKPLHRSLKVRQMEHNLRQMSQAGITFGLDLIYGLPGDTHHGFQKSLNFTLKQQPNQVDIFPLAVLPGTELYDKQKEFGIRGAATPPYQLLSNTSYSAEDLDSSRLLAAATDIFYNRGRAVGFFLPLCNSLGLTPVDFLSQFGTWLENEKSFRRAEILAIENWQPRNIVPLQHEFSRRQLISHNKKALLKVAEDLINFHFCCAETLLAEDCRTGRKIPQRQWSKQRWQLNRSVLLQKFSYALEDLELAAGETLEHIKKQVSREPGVAIFLRQQGEVVCETLDDTFAAMLCAAKKGETGRQLITGIDPQLGEELLDFAIRQGLLQPC